MQGAKRTIRLMEEKRVQLLRTMEVLMGLMPEDLPGTAGISMTEGIWLDLAGPAEYKEFRQKMRRRMTTKRPDRPKRYEGGDIRIMYLASTVPFTNEELELINGKYYVGDSDMLSSPGRPVCDMVVVINAGPECKKVLKGTESREVYEWVCGEDANV